MPVDGRRELASHAHEHLGVEFGGTTSDGAVTLEQVFCLGKCASVSCGDGGRPAEGQGRRSSLRRSRRRRRGLRRSDECRLPSSSPSTRPPAPSAPTRSQRPSSRRPPARPAGSARAKRLTRHVLARAARGGHDADGRVAYGPVEAKTSESCSTPGCSTARATGSFWARRRRLPTSSDRRASPLREWGSYDPCRSRTTRRTGGSQACAGPRDDTAGDRDRGDRVRAQRSGRCGFPTGVKWQTVLDASADSSSSPATRTRATAAPSPIACSWRATRSSWWREWPSPAWPSARAKATYTSARSTRTP